MAVCGIKQIALFFTRIFYFRNRITIIANYARKNVKNCNPFVIVFLTDICYNFFIKNNGSKKQNGRFGDPAQL